ncbi:hypothetical protein PINS_up012971 [Pythium insidiosum]|nr:hypothetical protein PINS_up012971 [Pythium insidiosum]
MDGWMDESSGRQARTVVDPAPREHLAVAKELVLRTTESPVHPDVPDPRVQRAHSEECDPRDLETAQAREIEVSCVVSCAVERVEESKQRHDLRQRVLEGVREVWPPRLRVVDASQALEEAPPL